jgi:hypothetical protein
MRRLICAAVLALLALGALAASATALDPPERDKTLRAPSPERRFGAGPSSHLGFTPLGAALGGSAVLQGTVLTYGGAGFADTSVVGAAPDGTGWDYDETVTGPSGSYTLSGFAATAGEGEIWAFPPAPYYFARVGLTWSDPGPTTFDFRPGALNVSVHRGGIWDYWSGCGIDLAGADAVSAVWSGGGIDGPDPDVSPVTGVLYPQAGSYTQGAAYFWSDEGLEFSTSLTVNPGEMTGGSLVLDERDAQRIWVVGPYWASGKPGTSATLWLNHYPAGWQVGLTGYSEYPESFKPRVHAGWTATGAEDAFIKRTVPTSATPGYAYWFNAERLDGSLYLSTPFQVCTLKASKTSIRKGTAIRLSGVIPTQGHWGAQRGKAKTVVIYKRTKSAGQPTAWDATAKGWTKVASVKANGLGKYLSGYLRPKRTTWYIVRYPGDQWYWRGYTSVVKVTVR